MWIQRLSLVLLVAAAPALAHHSVAVNFDPEQTVEYEGEIVEVAWRNPHILLRLAATDGSGAEWDLETHSLSIMRRIGAAEPFVEVGERVRVSGWPSRRGAGMFVNNMLLPSGEEFVFKFGAEPADLVWSDRMWGTNQRWFAESGSDADEERGIYRVWSTTFLGGQGFFWPSEFPLTEAARARREAFVPERDGPLLNCGLKGMPGIMSAPYPLEFLDRGDTIEVHIEEYDTVRTIYLNPETTPEPVPSIYGHSVGRWEGETLVVDTTHLNWGHLQGRGVIVTNQIEVEERFTLMDGGGRLEYQITVTDPGTFTEPLVMGKSWVWIPDVRVEPYECIPDE